MPLVVCTNFRRITHRFRNRPTSCFNAENHILPTPLVFDIEFEGCRWNVETKFGARKLV